MLTCCKKESDTVSGDMGENFFPDDSGAYVIYKVDSMIFDDFTQTTRTSTIYLKEKVMDQFTDNLGRLAKRIERYYSDTIPTVPSSWQIFNAFYMVKTSRNVERVEDNLRYIKMVFPNNNGEKWLGMRYIISPPPYIIDSSNYRVNDWVYTIQDKDVTYDNSFKIFDSTLTVFHIYDSSAINKTYSIEKYSRNIGLTYKEFWIVTAQTQIGLPWIDRAEKGFIMWQYAIDYGKE
ncbi:MAG: hypothetical protein JWN78_767 [Bacteroidota bacterium]|nr:hypothetical protein [Bacteroidota bacterium]